MNTHRQHTRRPGIRRLGILFASLGLVTAVTACSGGDQSSRSESSAFDSPLTEDRDRPGSTPTEAVDPETSTERDHGSDDGSTPEKSSPAPGATADESGGGSSGPAGERRRTTPSERSVIQTAVVSVASDEVGNARFDAKEIVDRHSGEIAEEETGTSDGEVSRVRMVIRVPQQDFDGLITELSELGELRSATRSSEDVSTQVIDTRSRLQSQERSIKRIQALLSEAEDLSEVVAIEAQLASRQADLDSLKSQLAWLEDQSSLSTVTLSLSGTTAEAAEEENDETGFLAGFDRGWNGLVDAANGVATGLGTVLPFSLALGLLLLPVWILIRRRPRRQRPSAATPA